jgi:hypothetical protein
MAATSKWHKITNITDDDLAGSLNGLGGHVFNECTLELDGDAAVTTKPFDFPVTGDLTIVVNSNAKNITDDYIGANTKITVQGSVDGVSWIDLDTSSAFTGGVTIDTKAQMHLYDYDEEGRFPYMRLSLIGHTSATHTAESIKIAVIPH